jgi:hypothetical protein
MYISVLIDCESVHRVCMAMIVHTLYTLFRKRMSRVYTWI